MGKSNPRYTKRLADINQSIVPTVDVSDSSVITTGSSMPVWVAHPKTKKVPTKIIKEKFDRRHVYPSFYATPIR
jgi:hypothetical protein